MVYDLGTSRRRADASCQRVETLVYDLGTSKRRAAAFLRHPSPSRIDTCYIEACWMVLRMIFALHRGSRPLPTTLLPSVCELGTSGAVLYTILTYVKGPRPVQSHFLAPGCVLGSSGRYPRLIPAYVERRSLVSRTSSLLGMYWEADTSLRHSTRLVSSVEKWSELTPLSSTRPDWLRGSKRGRHPGCLHAAR